MAIFCIEVPLFFDLPRYISRGGLLRSMVEIYERTFSYKFAVQFESLRYRFKSDLFSLEESLCARTEYTRRHFLPYTLCCTVLRSC